MLKFAYKISCGKHFLLTLESNMAAVGTLEEEARKRRERLKALKGKRGGAGDESGPPGKKGAGESEEKLPK